MLVFTPTSHIYWYLIKSGKSCVWKICLWGKSLCGKSFVEKPVRKNFPLRLSGKSYWVVKVVQKKMWTGIDCAENTLTELMRFVVWKTFHFFFLSSWYFWFVPDFIFAFSSLSFSETLQNNNCRSIYEYCLEKSVRASCDLIWGKFVIHSVRFFSGKSFFFVWKIFR